MSRHSQLAKAGLTNSESPSYEELATSYSRSPPTPWCSSTSCCTLDRVNGQKTRRREIRKYLKGYPDMCPDCGDALFWKNEPPATRS